MGLEIVCDYMVNMTKDAPELKEIGKAFRPVSTQFLFCFPFP